MTQTSATHALRYLANCSLLFTELPILERPMAAREAGFDAIEFWWPFQTPTPTTHDVDAFIASVQKAGVRLVGLNYWAGDLAGPDCGVLSIPARAHEFRESVQTATEIGGVLGITAFNALYGNRVPGITPEKQDAVAIESLLFATRMAGTIHAAVLIEAVSGPKPYPLRTAADAIGVVDKVRALGSSNIGFLLDIFHLSANAGYHRSQEDVVDAAIANHTDITGHVQIADFPGRGEPGSGSLDLNRYLSALESRGYSGWVGLEYKPTGGVTLDSLAWLPTSRNTIRS
jgi:hydroxypyruvate isomerase